MCGDLVKYTDKKLMRETLSTSSLKGTANWSSTQPAEREAKGLQVGRKGSDENGRGGRERSQEAEVVARVSSITSRS